MSDEVIYALKNWFGINTDSSLSVLQDMWVKGDLLELYKITQSVYRDKGIDRVHLYRWENGVRENEELLSWTTDLEVALRYRDLWKVGCLKEEDIEVSRILLNTDFEREYNLCWNSLLGSYSSQEVICVNKIGLVYFCAK